MEPLQGRTWLEEVCHSEWALRFYNLSLLPFAHQHHRIAASFLLLPYAFSDSCRADPDLSDSIPLKL